METHDHYMSRALELAAAPLSTSPNPRVGAVLVRDGAVIGEGAHLGVGSPHAEAAALQGTGAKGSTMYVTLEPCAHQGRTPPCAHALVNSGVAAVVVAIRDPDARVQGAGLAYLREHGVEVVEGVLADEASQLNRAYLHQRTTGRPLVTLKLALSLDGKLAAPDRSSRWITGPESRRRVHERRAECDAILIGAGTVLEDDPALTVRDLGTTRQPARVICDGRGRVPASARVFDEPGEVIVATTISCPPEIQAAWKEAGAEVLVVDQDDAGALDLRVLVQTLAGKGWLEVYCEGGAELATSLLRTGDADRLELYQGPVMVGGDGVGLGTLGVTGMDSAHRWLPVMHEQLGSDTVTMLERAP